MSTPETVGPSQTHESAADVLDQLAGVAPGSPAARLREQRSDLTRFSQATYESLLEPETDDGLPRKEREMVALRVALLTPDERLAKWHEDRLAAGSETAATVSAVTEFPAVSPDLTPREVAILRHTDLVTIRPTDAEPSDVEALRVVGLSTLEIVTLSQLIAFVAFQVRVLATLRAFRETSRAHEEVQEQHRDPARPRRDRMSHLPEFTRRVVDWTPWIDTIDDIDAAPDQLAIVDEIVGSRKTGRTYWAALAHDADVLRHRHDLFPETLRDKAGEGGSPRSDLELSAVAGSRVTGCVYCASVHARAYVQLAQNGELIDAVLTDGVAAAIPARERALVAFSAKLADAPRDITASDLTPMRDAGFSDLAIYDIAHASAMFAWANRLLLTLGGQTVDREAAVE